MSGLVRSPRAFHCEIFPWNLGGGGVMHTGRIYYNQDLSKPLASSRVESSRVEEYMKGNKKKIKMK
jgi:hypothetical protein